MLLAVAVMLAASTGLAAPQAKILRIDPRASMVDGAPLLTTVIDLVQFKALSDITSRCAHTTGNANLDCVADELEKPLALYDPFKFPEDNAILMVSVDGRDQPATFVSVERWANAKKEEGVGTAWLILVDAAASMGSRMPEAQAVAKEFINRMGPQDIVNVMYFNDRAVVKNSKWLNKKAAAVGFVDSVGGPYPSHGRTRPLFNIIKQGATDAFRELGNAGSSLQVPMHQAMVVLSNGVSGSDPASAAQSALLLKEYMTKGRFPEDNQTLPKAPVPIISIWFPAQQMEEFFQNARQFMENLANPEIGGFHSIVREKQTARAAKIVNVVTRRFDGLHLIKWRVPCVAPTVGQTFKLVFKNVDPPIAGDNFIDVPVGIDPSTWPLDVDVDQTLSYAKKNPLYPGGTIKIFGDFCWGSDHKRAELYMIPKNQPVPESLKGRSLEEAKKAQQTLVASNMVGKAVSAGDTFVEFELPDDPKFLRGKDKDMEALAVVFDKHSGRTSAITSDKILTLPATKKPLNLFLIGGLTFGGVVLILLVIQMFRGGGGSRRRGRGAAPPPVVAGGHPPGPPGPGGYPR
jgi:hypothetical protein